MLNLTFLETALEKSGQFVLIDGKPHAKIDAVEVASHPGGGLALKFCARGKVVSSFESDARMEHGDIVTLKTVAGAPLLFPIDLKVDS